MAQTLARIYEHLALVKEHPSKPLDDIVLRELNPTIANNLSGEDRARLLGAAQELLPDLQQDVTPLTSLLLRLIEPDIVTFEQVDDLLAQSCLLSQRGTSDDQYLMGLESDNKDITMLILNLLHKATKSLSSIGLLASKAKVVQGIIRLILISPETALVEKAGDILEACLVAGEIQDDATTEKNLMARRIFRDRDIYESLFSLTSLQTVGLEGQLSKRQKTIAQTRLLNLIVNIDHPRSPIRVSQFPEIEQQYGKTGSKQGILYYAFVLMIDFTDDDLLLSTFIQLCTKYISSTGHFGHGSSDYAVKFLKENGLHARCMLYFLNPSPTFGSWLISDSATYVHVYCRWHEDDLLKDKNLCNQIVDCLSHRFKTTSRSEWQVNAALNSPLLVLGSLPRRLLVPTSLASIDGLPPLFDVPAYSSNPRVLQHLKRIFCESRGPHQSSRGALTAEHRIDRMTARVLYLKYLERNPNFWEKVVELADDEGDTVAALSAIDFMHEFADADWEPVDQSLAPYLPSEDEIIDLLERNINPLSGLQGMLLEDGANIPVGNYFFSPYKPSSLDNQVLRPFASSKDSVTSVPMAKVRLTSRVRDLIAKEVAKDDHLMLMEDLLEEFNAKVQSNTKEMREAGRVREGEANSVATMRR